MLFHFLDDLSADPSSQLFTETVDEALDVSFYEQREIPLDVFSHFKAILWQQQQNDPEMSRSIEQGRRMLSAKDLGSMVDEVNFELLTVTDK